MGQRVSVSDEQRKSVNIPITPQREIIEIVYEDAAQIEQECATTSDQPAMEIEEAANSVLESSATCPINEQSSPLFQRLTKSRTKLSRKSMQLVQATDPCDSTLSLVTNSPIKQSILKNPETNWIQNSFPQSSDDNQCLKPWSQEHPTSIGLGVFRSPIHPDYLVGEKGEVVESMFLPTTSMEAISPEETTELTSGIQSLEKRAISVDHSFSLSESQSLLGDVRNNDKRRRLWHRVLNHRKRAEFKFFPNPESTMTETTVSREQNDDKRVYRKLLSSSTTSMGETQPMNIDSLTRSIILNQPVPEETSLDLEQSQFGPVSPDCLSTKRIDSACDSSQPRAVRCSLSREADRSDLNQTNTTPQFGHSRDDHYTLELVHSASEYSETIPIPLHKDWRDDPRFTEGLENEFLSASSGPHCTTVTVSAVAPRAQQGGRLKTLTLITLKPDGNIVGDGELRAVGGSRGAESSSINLDVTIDPNSADVSLVPECLRLMKNSDFVRSQKRFGPLSAETAFIGGNVTGRYKKLTKRRHSKSDVPCQSRSAMSAPPLIATASSPSNLTLSRPIHIYTYRFWVCCEPWVEQLFRNPMDRRIESIGRVSDCRIRLTRRRRRNPKGFRQQMVSIVAPSADALEKCCKLFDDKFPCFYATAGLILSHDQLVRLSSSWTAEQADSCTEQTSRRCRCQSTVPPKVRPKLAPQPHVHGDAADISVSTSKKLNQKTGVRQRFSSFW